MKNKQKQLKRNVETFIKRKGVPIIYKGPPAKGFGWFETNLRYQGTYAAGDIVEKRKITTYPLYERRGDINEEASSEYNVVKYPDTLFDAYLNVLDKRNAVLSNSFSLNSRPKNNSLFSKINWKFNNFLTGKLSKSDLSKTINEATKSYVNLLTLQKYQDSTRNYENQPSITSFMAISEYFIMCEAAKEQNFFINSFPNYIDKELNKIPGQLKKIEYDYDVFNDELEIENQA